MMITCIYAYDSLSFDRTQDNHVPDCELYHPKYRMGFSFSRSLHKTPTANVKQSAVGKLQLRYHGQAHESQAGNTARGDINNMASVFHIPTIK